MAKRAKAKTPRPNRFARRLDDPCPRCGGEWGNAMVVLDPDAEELETFVRCAGCLHRIGQPA